MALMVKIGGGGSIVGSAIEGEAVRKASKIIGSAFVEVYPESDGTFADITFEAADGTLYQFDPAPLVDFSKEKHIVTTDINDGKGEVVEIISTRAWVISMQGVLIDESTRTHPRRQIEELLAFFDLNESLRVYGDLFEEKGISDIFFRGIGLPGEAGKPDTQEYNLSARSIVPPEISLIET